MNRECLEIFRQFPRLSLMHWNNFQCATRDLGGRPNDQLLTFYFCHSTVGVPSGSSPRTLVAANTINQQLAAVRRLAREASDAGLLSPRVGCRDKPRPRS